MPLLKITSLHQRKENNKRSLEGNDYFVLPELISFMELLRILVVIFIPG